MKIFFSKSAVRNLKKIDSKNRRRILSKLRFYVSQKNIKHFADKLADTSLGQWRFRIGDYRVICDMSKNKLVVLKVGHRKDIYR